MEPRRLALGMRYVRPFRGESSCKPARAPNARCRLAAMISVVRSDGAPRGEICWPLGYAGRAGGWQKGKKALAPRSDATALQIDCPDLSALKTGNDMDGVTLRDARDET